MGSVDYMLTFVLQLPLPVHVTTLQLYLLYILRQTTQELENVSFVYLESGADLDLLKQ